MCDAPHDVVDVLAKLRGVGPWLARSNAKFGIRHEVGPFVVLHHLAERVPEDEPTNRVPVAVSTYTKQTNELSVTPDCFLESHNIHIP